MLNAVLLSLSLTGCVEDVAKDKAVAEVRDVQKSEAPRGTAAGEPWPIDASSSSVRALGAKITAKHPIDFKRFTGGIKVDGDRLTVVDFAVDMASLESDDPDLTAHLKDEEFFHVAKYPKAKFVSHKVASGGSGGTHTVAGVLTIRGVSKEVVFPATIAVAKGTATARAEFAIDRQDFGITYPGKPDDLIQDNVVLTIEFVARPR